MIKEHLKTAWRISSAEYYCWIRHTRIIILGVMLVFIHIQIILPLKSCARLMNEKLSYAEPFTAMSNSGAVCLIIPMLFLVLMAEFPEKTGVHLFYQIRCGKKTWIYGQTLFAAKASISLVLFLAVTSGLMCAGSGEWRMEFSHAVTHYTAAFPERSNDYVLRLLPENLYHQMTLGTAFFHTVILMLLSFLLLSMVLLLSSLYAKKNIGILADAFLIIAGTLTTSIKSKLMWLFPMAHTLPGVHYSKYFSQAIFPIEGSYIYLAAGSGILFLCCAVSAKKYQAGKV